MIKLYSHILKNNTLFLVAISLALSCNQVKKDEEEISIQSEKITEEEAMGLLHSWTNAYLKGDPAPLNELLDDSWLYSGSSDGLTHDKANTIQDFSNADYTFADIVYENVDVRLYNDIAVVRGSETMTILGNNAQDTTILRLRFTDVYQKKNGKVKAISTHSSPIEE